MDLVGEDAEVLGGLLISLTLGPRGGGLAAAFARSMTGNCPSDPNNTQSCMVLHFCFLVLSFRYSRYPVFSSFVRVFQWVNSIPLQSAGAAGTPGVAILIRQQISNKSQTRLGYDGTV